MKFKYYLNERDEKALERKFFGKKLTFIDPYAGENLFIGYISANEYGLYVIVEKSFDSYFKVNEKFYNVVFDNDYIRIGSKNDPLAIWDEEWSKKYN